MILWEKIILRKNNRATITYTKEFKEKFHEEYRVEKLPSQILSDMGIDHHILGKRRKDGLVAKMKIYELRPEGFEDIRKKSLWSYGYKATNRC